MDCAYYRTIGKDYYYTKFDCNLLNDMNPHIPYYTDKYIYSQCNILRS